MLPPVLDTRNDQGCRCFVWQIEIDDGRHPVDIDAAGGNVGGDGVGRSAPRAVSTSAPKFARLFAGGGSLERTRLWSPNSLLAGKIQGISSIRSSVARQRGPKRPSTQCLMSQFPTRPNREFFEALQGIKSGDQGNFFPHQGIRSRHTFWHLL